LLTGADGHVGSVIRTRLADAYEWRLLSRDPMDVPSFMGDIADYDAIRPAFDGVDAVVHMAAAAAVDSPWDEVLSANIIGTRNVFEAARDAGVPHVVFASSNHAIGGYERDGRPEIYEPNDARLYDENVELRPDSLYGVSKGFGELLGRFYSDTYGMRVICLRIGWVGESDEPPRDHPAGEAIWLSPRDCAHLVDRALQTSVRWAVVYGISNNPRAFWDLTSARELLGYEPRDSAPPASSPTG
jgi:NAD+ dependent glucose-6-phosphate dehydrogenase